jgi:hypothetical protein
VAERNVLSASECVNTIACLGALHTPVIHAATICIPWLELFLRRAPHRCVWFYAMYLMGSTRCGISAKQVQRETGVTYKTAWRMFRQIRSLLSESGMQLEGSTVEVDEMYYRGKRKTLFWVRSRM